MEKKEVKDNFVNFKSIPLPYMMDKFVKMEPNIFGSDPANKFADELLPLELCQSIGAVEFFIYEKANELKQGGRAVDDELKEILERIRTQQVKQLE